MRKLISIGLILALLVTFLVPGIVGAQAQNCTECGPDQPCPAQPPTNCAGTRTMGGALLWTLLSTTYLMGRAVGDVTETIAGTLGCYVDELAVPVFGLIAALLTGLGGLLDGLGTLIGMESIFGPLASMLADIADVITNLLPA